MKIHHPISIENVYKVCPESAVKLTIWLANQNDLDNISYEKELSLTLIESMPLLFIEWLEKKSFIETRKQFNSDHLFMKGNILYWKDPNHEIITWEIIEFKDGRLRRPRSIPKEATPFKVDIEGRIVIMED